MLERKVKELEGLLREAEEDVKVVVQRVTRSQIEVAELQTERDEALRAVRRLQRSVEEERERVEGVVQ
jgi:predicted  nucleic acid-binding Zn-ribbon protein